MKLLLFIFLLLPFGLKDSPISDDCKCKGIALYGYVKVVDIAGDFKVRITNSLEDLTVDSTVAIPRKCGEWVFVRTGEDFTIEIVESFEDFTVNFRYGLAGLNR